MEKRGLWQCNACRTQTSLNTALGAFDLHLLEEDHPENDRGTLPTARCSVP